MGMTMKIYTIIFSCPSIASQLFLIVVLVEPFICEEISQHHLGIKISVSLYFAHKCQQQREKRN